MWLSMKLPKIAILRNSPRLQLDAGKLISLPPFAPLLAVDGIVCRVAIDQSGKFGELYIIVPREVKI